ncbi:MAG TPA: hypothetical protein VI299_26955, partial [Polyangiales bacterium]
MPPPPVAPSAPPSAPATAVVPEAAVEAPPQDSIPEPPPLPPMPEQPAVAPEKPAEAPPEVAVQATDAEPAYVSQDGVDHHASKPIFDVGSYHVQASGYVQGQYINVQGSENELSPDGRGLLNQTGFAVPRVRAVIEGANNWSGAVLEY